MPPRPTVATATDSDKEVTTNNNNFSNCSKKSRVDRLGAALSTLCLVHCALIPVVGAFLPIIENEATDALVHLGFLSLALPITSVAIFNSTRSQNHFATLSLLIGLAVMSAGLLLPALHAFEAMLSISGGLLLIAGHALNCKCEAENCAVSKQPTTAAPIVRSRVTRTTGTTTFFDQAPV